MKRTRLIVIIVTVWMATVVIFLAGMILPKILELNVLKFIEVFSSWFTVACTLCLGLLSAILVARQSVNKALLVATAYSAIFICYIGYVTIDYGASEPEVAAIGFNIATILQCLSIWKVSQLLKSHK